MIRLDGLLRLGFREMLAVQTLTNICMTIGLGPITGVTLPFVSRRRQQQW